MPSGVLFLPSYYEAIKQLPDAERLMMYDAITRYGLYGEVIELPPLLNALFLMCKPNIDSSNNRYAAAVENGKKGGRPPKNQKHNQKHNQDYDYDTDYDKDEDKEIEKEAEVERELQRGNLVGSTPSVYKPLSDAEFNAKREDALRKLNTHLTGNGHG